MLTGRAWHVGVLAIGLLIGSVLLAVTAGASAKHCGMVVTSPDPLTLELHPSTCSIAYAGHVTFTNNTSFAVTVKVDPGYSRQLAAGGTADYAGTSTGPHQVTAAVQPAGRPSARGSITVDAKPSGSPSPTPSHHSPAPSPSSRPSATPAPGSPSATGPQVAPTPSGAAPHPSLSPSPRPSASATASPAGVASPAPSPAVHVVSGPLEPPSGRGTGLPAALAALAVVGTGTALVRVLLAEPVDDAGRAVVPRP
ncbi:MAG: hypothetical protein JO222_13190 [Frankiales bacterium]|nr:hypothetical protein [Frankiales bacterium]